MSAPVFRSVDRPELGPMGPEDVELCNHCGELSGPEYREAVSTHGHQCPTCQGWRLVLGHSDGGRAWPVALVDTKEIGR